MSDRTVAKDPWENILLGGFIFSLGYRFGAAGQPRGVFSPNMLAHTPIDPYLGDFLGKSDFRGFLVEFKRNWGERLTEQDKKKFLLIDGMGRRAETLKCHFMGYGYKTATGKSDLKFGDYFKLALATNESDVKCYCMDKFLREIVQGRIGANSDEFRFYLGELIRRLTILLGSGPDAESKVAELDSALRGAAILYTQDGFCTLPFSSFTEFTTKMGIAQSIELEAGFKKSITEKRSYEDYLKRNPYDYKIRGSGFDINEDEGGIKI